MIRTKLYGRWALVTSLVALAVLPIAAHAQTAAASAVTPNAAQTDNGATLAEVVVTAQKRAENLQTVPITVQAFDAKALAAEQIVDAATLQNSVPGLNVTRAAFATDVFLRGVGNFTATPGVEGAVAIYVDDVYHPSPVGSTFSYNNVANIEVDKGPQGTLFGRNAAGGVIQVFTRNPQASPELDVDVGFGNYNTVTTDIYGTTQIAPNLVSDVALQYMDQTRGWGTNYYNGQTIPGQDETSARTKTIWTPTDRTTVRFIFDYDKSLVGGQYIVCQPSVCGGDGIEIGGYPHVGGYYDVNTNLYAQDWDKAWGLSLKATQDLGWSEITSISSFRKENTYGISNNDADPVTIAEGTTVALENDATQEFQIAAPSSSTVKWIGGVFLFSDKAQRDPQAGFNIPSYCKYPQCYEAVFATQNSTSYAVYGQAEMPVGDDSQLTLGARYTVDHRNISGETLALNGAVVSAPPEQEHSWPKATYKAALDHKFTPVILGYVSYSTGFNSGTYSVNNPGAPLVNPVTVDSYELGIKSDWFDHRLRVNVAGFYTDYSNLQIQEVVTNPVTLVQAATLLNSASATIPGVDVDVDVAATDHLTITSGLEYINARYGHFPNAVFLTPCTSPKVNAACGASVSGGGYYNYSGNGTDHQVQYAQPTTVNLGAQYDIPMPTGDVTLAANATHNSGFYFDVQNTLPQSAYTMVNATATWTAPDGKWYTKLWVENLLGKQYIAQGQASSAGYTYLPAPPRFYGVKVGYHWGH